MGHRDKILKVGRTTSHREAMLANMAMSLFEHRLIRTTEAKARALKPVVDRLIATAKKNDLNAKRQVARTVHKKNIFKKLFSEILPHFEDRNSGFSRIVKLGVRRGDGASLSVVELLIDKPAEAADEKEKGKKKKRSASSRLASKPKPKKKKAAAKK